MANDDKKQIEPYPTKDDRQFGFHAASATLTGAAGFLFPGASYVVQQVLNKAVGNPLERRRADWFRRVGEGLAELQSRLSDFDPASIGENEQFISAVQKATDIAMRTHQEKKREALRNAVMNIAAGCSLDDILLGSFMDYIDRFSAAHIQILERLNNPAAYPAMVGKARNITMGSQWPILLAGAQDIGIDERVLDRICQDLTAAGLIEGSGMKAMGTSNVLLAKRTTDVGEAFLKFISNPET